MSKVDLEYLEVLSKLKLSDSEKAQFEKDFDKIIDFVNEIAEVNTDSVSDKVKAIPLSMLREDEAKESMAREAVLQNAPKQKDGCYVTPLVVE